MSPVAPLQQRAGSVGHGVGPGEMSTMSMRKGSVARQGATGSRRCPSGGGVAARRRKGTLHGSASCGAAVGGVAVGGIAVGGVAVGIVAVGGVAVGLYAVGGVVVGERLASLKLKDLEPLTQQLRRLVTY